MKTKFLLAIFGAALLATGCVNTVDGHKKAAMPFGRDKIMGQYQRPVEQAVSYTHLTLPTIYSV